MLCKCQVPGVRIPESSPMVLQGACLPTPVEGPSLAANNSRPATDVGLGATFLVAGEIPVPPKEATVPASYVASIEHADPRVVLFLLLVACNWDCLQPLHFRNHVTARLQTMIIALPGSFNKIRLISSSFCPRAVNSSTIGGRI